MILPNTVPITAEELDHLIDNNIDCITYQSDTKFIGWWKPQTASKGLETRIKAHDYRHYFGEVVDLSKKETLIAGVKWRVECLDHTFEVHRYSWECKVYKDYENETTPLVSGTQPQCQQWLCDYFTALFKKDLPHLNIKFVWS